MFALIEQKKREYEAENHKEPMYVKIPVWIYEELASFNDFGWFRDDIASKRSEPFMRIRGLIPCFVQGLVGFEVIEVF